LSDQEVRSGNSARDWLDQLKSRIVTTRPWQSIVRHGWPDNTLDRSLVITSNLFLHLHPVKVNRKSLRWSYSFGLGIISAILFGVLIFTGILLMFYYIPSIEKAYPSMKEIQLLVPLGQFTRNMHRWSAHGMVIAVVLHMVRVFYTGAYKPPREFNWVIGVFLLLLTLGASFTGYLLPWDQLSYWAITVGTNIAGYAPVVGQVTRDLLLGESVVGQSALIRFYTLHIAILPLIITLLVSIHFWRIRKDGGLAANEVDNPTEGSSDD
jgi:quinol-cytochrome oxidoreductase complex cytochrome b subunit